MGNGKEKMMDPVSNNHVSIKQARDLELLWIHEASDGMVACNNSFGSERNGEHTNRNGRIDVDSLHG
jgi:hypothetical protein